MFQGCRHAIDWVKYPLQEGLVAALGQGNQAVQGCLQAKPRLQATGNMPAQVRNNINAATIPHAVPETVAVRSLLFAESLLFASYYSVAQA